VARGNEKTIEKPKKANANGLPVRRTLTGANLDEAQLWQTADALRGSMDAAERKHLAMNLIVEKSEE